MSKIISGLMLILILSAGKTDISAAKDFPKAMIVGLQPIAITTVFNPLTKKFEGAGSSEFLVVVTDYDCDNSAGKVSITRIIEPSGLPKSSFTASLSRSDFNGPSTRIILTEKISAPLITPSGIYNGLVEITVINNF